MRGHLEQICPSPLYFKVKVYKVTPLQDIQIQTMTTTNIELYYNNMK